MGLAFLFRIPYCYKYKRMRNQFTYQQVCCCISKHLSELISIHFIISVELMDADNNTKMRKRKTPRHTPHQIQQLEAIFKECRNPNENQKRQLSRELGLGENQIKVWFQNKRNQRKAQSDHVDNNALRSENKRLQNENLAFSERLKNAICLSCADHPPVGEEERKLNIEKLRRENAQLREEYERIANEITSWTGKPITHLLSLSPESLERFPSLPAKNLLSSRHKEVIVEQALVAKNELITLALDETLWFRSPANGAGDILHLENYYHKFPKSSHLRTSSSRIETSRDSFIVPIPAPDLFEIFMDTNRWAALFPTIVTEAWNIETLNTASHGEAILHLMNVRMHILSPLVAPREFYFYRYGCQADKGIWVIVDASSDCFINIQDDTSPTCCWKFPSGLIISSLDHGKASLVTWIEHIEVNESLNHPLVRNLLSTIHGYGATRWLSTLERMCERSLYSAKHAIASSDRAMQGVLSAPEARRSFLTLTHRMIKDFCATLNQSSRSDLSELTNGMVRMSVRTNKKLPGQPLGEIVSLSTSVRLPLTFKTIFDFLRDVSRRHEWDAMLSQSPMNEMTRLATGAHPGNYVSYMQPTMYKEGQVWWIQENSVDRLGALIVFAPIHPSVMEGISRGVDTSMEPILPCGFLISGDQSVISGDQSVANGQGLSDGASSSSGSGSRLSGSLLTLNFQTLVWRNQLEAVNYLNSIISNTIQNLRLFLGCPELDY